MIFLRLYGENIFSFNKVSFELKNKGLVLISGENNNGENNGTGKTTLSNKILSWCLFGQTPCGAKTNDAIKLGSSSQTIANVEFIGIDGNKYIVARYRNPNGLALLKGSQDLSSRLESETQVLINEKLGMNFDVFCNTVFFGRSKNSEFLLQTPKSQLEIIEQILDVEKIEEYTERSKNFYNQVNQTYEKNKMFLSSLEGSMNSILMEINNWESKLKHFPSIPLNLPETLKSLYNWLQPTAIEIKRLQDKSNQLFRQKSSIQLEMSKLLPIINKKIQTANCPECNQTIENQKHQQLIEQVQEAKIKYSELEKSLNVILIEEKQLNSLSSLTQDYNLKLNEYTKLNSFVGLFQQKETFEQALIDAKNKYKNVEFDKDVIALAIQNNIEELDHLKFWKNVFAKDIRNYMIEQSCPYLNLRVRHHLNGLNHPEFKVNFSTVKVNKNKEEKIEFNVEISRETGGNGYGNLSMGEKQLVSFAIALALGELAETKIKSKSNLLILDEPFSNLDGKNCEAVVNYINSSLSKLKETILLISNDESLKELVPNQVHIFKDSEGSYLD